MIASNTMTGLAQTTGRSTLNFILIYVSALPASKLNCAA